MPKQQTKYLIIAKTFNRRGRQIAIGANSYRKTHSVMQHYATLAGQPEKIYLHAEVQCLLRSKDHDIHTLSIERYDSEGNPALAKPCPVCSIALRSYGVKFIKYTTDQGWVKEKVE